MVRKAFTNLHEVSSWKISKKQRSLPILHRLQSSLGMRIFLSDSACHWRNEGSNMLRQVQCESNNYCSGVCNIEARTTVL